MPYKGGRRPKAQLRYDFDKYTPHGLKDLTEQELRREYSRLRSIAQKRLNRMGESEFSQSKTYKYHKDRYATTRSIKSEAQLRHKLSDLARFIESDRGSVSGQKRIRDKAIKTFQENGYDFVTKENFQEVTEFLNEAVQVNRAFAKSSDQLLDYFDMLSKEGKSQEEILDAMKKWSRSRELLDPVQNTRRRDSRQIRRALE